MSDYNLQVFTPDGKTAINSLYNSYYVYSEGTGVLVREDFQWTVSTKATRAVATILAPATINPYTQPILLLKNNNKSMIGGFSTQYSNGQISSWKVVGDAVGGTFDYAIAVSENGVVSSDNYGIQMFAENGADVIFDSRRTGNLIYKAWGGISSGYTADGTISVSTTFDYFSAPIMYKSVYLYLGTSGGSPAYAIGNVCFKGNGAQTLTYRAYLVGRELYYRNIGNGGTSSAKMLFFSKGT